jgi:5'-nucleotidase
MNIHTACLGNHDFDFGLENLERFIKSTNFPWLMANVLDKDTNKPLAGAEPSRLCEWQGIKVQFGCLLSSR